MNLKVIIGGVFISAVTTLLCIIARDIFTPKKKPKTAEDELLTALKKLSAQEHERLSKKLGGK